MKHTKAILMTSLLIASAASYATDPQAMALKNGCLACHQIDVKVIGPAYKDVANKYVGQKDAVEKLTLKVKNGGGGVWGNAGMPPHTHMKDEEIQTIVEWILSLKG